MAKNLQDIFKKHLAASDPVISKHIIGMNPKKKPSSLALEVKPLLENPDPNLKFAMFVSNVDDFAYSDEEDNEDDDDSDSDSDLDSEPGFEEEEEEEDTTEESDLEEEEEEEATPTFDFSQPTDASQSTDRQATDSQNTDYQTDSQVSESDSQEIIPSSQTET